MSRPFVFGYLVERTAGPQVPMLPVAVSLPMTPPARRATLGLFFDETAISRFASREGFELIRIYRDHTTDATSEPRRIGFDDMIAAARGRDDVAAVIVTTLNHLGADAVGQAEALRRIECVARVPLLTVRLSRSS